VKFFLQLVVIFAGINAAVADPIAIRTGEHENFTRVVLFLPDDTGWRVGRNEDGYVVRLSHTEGFDLNGFFDLIPQTRISGVSQVEDLGELRIAVGCQCNASAFLFDENVLVVDIRDGLPNRIASTELALGAPPLSTQRIGTQPLRRPEKGVVPIITDRASVNPAPILFNQVAPVARRAAASAGRVMEFEDEVALALGEGLTGRFLSEALASPTDNAREFADMETSGFDILPGIDARTSIDPISGQVSTSPEQTQEGQACLPDRYFAISNWSDGRTFNAQIGDSRLAIYQEFEGIDDSAVTALAQNFVHFGFGSEAMQVLQIDQVRSQERRYISEIAKLVDGIPADILAFQGQVSCNASVALWALLAHENDDIDGRIAKDRILRSFKELPEHLQQVLGPRLSQIFVRLGELDASMQILARTRSDATNLSEAAIANDTFARATQNDDSATKVLEEIVLGSARTTPKLMASFLQSKLNSGEVIRQSEFDLSDALRFEARGSIPFQDLTAVQIRAHLFADQFYSAREILELEGEFLREEMREELWNTFYLDAVDRMENAEFGRLVWEDQLLPENSELLTRFADRILQMGFPRRADQLRALAQVRDVTTRLSQPEPNSAVVDPSKPAVKSDAVSQSVAVEGLENVGGASSVSGTFVTLTDGRELVGTSAAIRESLTRRLQEISIPEGL
jgi:hypothetical protein